MLIEKEILINKNIQETWKVLGLDFANASKWASAVSHSEGSGNNFNGSSCSERGCSTTMGSIKEKLYEYSDEKHTLAYEVAEGMPWIVKYATNTWKLTELGLYQCSLQITMDIRMDGIVGKILEPVLKIQMSKIGNELLGDFAFYVENERPHPRKIKALNKKNMLKKYLTINSLFSALSGLAMVLLSSKLNNLFGIGNTYVLPIIGANLLFFSAYVSYVSYQKLTSKKWINSIIILDILWVLASISVVASRVFDLIQIGYTLISIVAVWIGFLAYKQNKYNN
jgi:hypothetical protein